MSTSIFSGNSPIQVSEPNPVSPASSKFKFSDHELIEALISLADMLDAASDEQPVVEESQETSLATNDSSSIEKFSFLSGWDRLMTRFRDNCSNRKTYSICF
jgi:hypothetical protein